MLGGTGWLILNAPPVAAVLLVPPYSALVVVFCLYAAAVFEVAITVEDLKDVLGTGESETTPTAALLR